MEKVTLQPTRRSNTVNQADIWEKSLPSREESLARRPVWLELKQPGIENLEVVKFKKGTKDPIGHYGLLSSLRFYSEQTGSCCMVLREE